MRPAVFASTLSVLAASAVEWLMGYADDASEAAGRHRSTSSRPLISGITTSVRRRWIGPWWAAISSARGRACGFEDDVAALFEYLPFEIPDELLVFHEQDGFCAARRTFARRPPLALVCVALGSRQVELGRGSSAWFAVDGDVSTALLDDPEHGRPARARCP